jgi:hypothetical protein
MWTSGYRPNSGGGLSEPLNIGSPRIPTGYELLSTSWVPPDGLGRDISPTRFQFEPTDARRSNPMHQKKN